MQRRTATSDTAHPVKRNYGRLVAALFWVGAAASSVFLGVIGVSGRLTLVNLLVCLVAIISLGAFGILALSGDLVWSDRAFDEGQLAASRNAQSLAFNIGYLGLIGLWMGYLFVPAWAANVTLHLGVLVLVITCLWFGTWIRQRWHG